jgi:hypothetical protein
MSAILIRFVCQLHLRRLGFGTQFGIGKPLTLLCLNLIRCYHAIHYPRTSIRLNKRLKVILVFKSCISQRFANALSHRWRWGSAESRLEKEQRIDSRKNCTSAAIRLYFTVVGINGCKQTLYATTTTSRSRDGSSSDAGDLDNAEAAATASGLNLFLFMV